MDAVITSQFLLQQKCKDTKEIKIFFVSLTSRIQTQKREREETQIPGFKAT